MIGLTYLYIYNDLILLMDGVDQSVRCIDFSPRKNVNKSVPFLKLPEAEKKIELDPVLKINKLFDNFQNNENFTKTFKYLASKLTVFELRDVCIKNSYPLDITVTLEELNLSKAELENKNLSKNYLDEHRILIVGLTYIEDDVLVKIIL